MPMPLAGTATFRRLLQPVMLRAVGIASIVELEHIGRRTGRVLHTPLMAFRDGDQVTIALTYGPEVQWLKNIQAAGGARLRTRSRMLQLGAPRSVGPAEGLSRVPLPQRALLRWPIRCHDFVVLPVLGDQPVG